MKRRNRQNSYERGGQVELAKAMGNVAKKGDKEINEGRDEIKSIRKDIETSNKNITNYKKGVEEQKSLIKKKEGFIKDIKKDLGGIYKTVQDAKKQKAKFAKGGEIASAIFSPNSKRGKISTSFGDKTKDGLTAMIENDSYSAKEIANAIFEFNEKRDKVKTFYGDKTKEGLITMIESARNSYAKGGKITIEGNPYGDGADGELGDFFIYRDGVEVVSWNRDELEEDEDVEDLAKEMFYLWKNDKEELGKRLDRISYAKGGKLNQGEKIERKSVRSGLGDMNVSLEKFVNYDGEDYYQVLLYFADINDATIWSQNSNLKDARESFNEYVSRFEDDAMRYAKGGKVRKPRFISGDKIPIVDRWSLGDFIEIEGTLTRPNGEYIITNDEYTYKVKRLRPVNDMGGVEIVNEAPSMMSERQLNDLEFKAEYTPSIRKRYKFLKEFAKGGSIKSVWELKERLEFALGDKDYVDSEIAKNNGEVIGLYNTFRDRLIEIGDDEYVRANDEFHAHSSNKLGDDGHGYYSKGGYVWVETDNIMDVEDFEEDGEVEFGSYEDMMDSLDEWNEQLDTNYSTIKEFNDGEEYRRIMTIKEFEEYKKDWLKDEGYAKGGEVEKKGNEMIIGGLAGILLGIFLNK